MWHLLSEFINTTESEKNDHGLTGKPTTSKQKTKQKQTNKQTSEQTEYQTDITPRVLNQDQNTQKVKKNAYYQADMMAELSI